MEQDHAHKHELLIIYNLITYYFNRLITYCISFFLVFTKNAQELSLILYYQYLPNISHLSITTLSSLN